MEHAEASRRRTVALGAALLLSAGLVGLRLHAFAGPLESDECNYLVIAERLMAGDRLYEDVWDHQPPGMFALCGLAVAVAGPEPFVLRTLALGAALLTLATLAAIGRAWGGAMVGWTAALLWVLVSSDPGVAGHGCNREVFMNALIVGAFCILRDRQRWTSPRLALAGTLFGLASALKTVVAVQWLAVAFVLASPAPDRTRWPVTARRWAWFGVGPLVVWAGMFVWFAVTGRAGAFFDAVFLYNLDYSATGLGLVGRVTGLFGNFSVWSSAAPLWGVGAAGFVVWCIRGSRPAGALPIAVALGALMAVALPGRFWPHYYILILPGAVLGCGLFVAALPTPRSRIASTVVLALGVGALQSHRYLAVAPERLGPALHAERMAWVRDQSATVAAATDPEDAIYVWSSDAGFYYYANRRCASRFTMNGALVGPGAAAARRRGDLVADLERTPPRLLLLPMPPCVELIDFMRRERYTRVGVDAPHGLEVWAPSDRNVFPQAWHRSRWGD